MRKSSYSYNNSHRENQDSGGIVFQYTLYDYSQQAMPIYYEVGFTGRQFVNLWGFFDVLTLPEIFCYIRDKECFEITCKKSSAVFTLNF